MTATETKSAKSPSWIWLLILGLLLTVGGIMCLFNPLASTFTALILAGATFMAAGIIQLIAAVADKEDSTGSRILGAILGLVLIVFAISLMRHPLAGIVSLTVLVAILFLISGLVRVILGFQLRPTSGWIFVLISGIISIVLAFMVFNNMPEIAAGLLGILLGVDLLSSGITTLLMAFGVRSLTKG
ncbi:HdeD family acid-resistance protein [Pseudoruegeria sp. SHC-113]|uniref:HdeD family acid-resistance protein n=1 Tax=Pseudoruegeria sp. SHC-113 TaxID=2855439 RepID=UPI0021BA7A8E|nr:DUF308 domain-containing protein [Pseudoruegeria sp. SHC-113]MCT8158798.1 DUF308 domain-containing protein [Pseudoruegeria sp. SHC-113]